MDLRISGNFRAIRKDCHKANQSIFAFYSPIKILLLRGGICQEAFDTADPDAQSSVNPVTWVDGVVQHDWGYLKSRSGRIHRSICRRHTLSFRSYETRATETVKHSADLCVSVQARSLVRSRSFCFSFLLPSQALTATAPSSWFRDRWSGYHEHDLSTTTVAFDCSTNPA